MRYRFRLLLMACVMLLLLPCRAHASTLVGSYDIPTDADVVACDFLGYDYNTMDSGLRSLLFNSTTTGGAGTDTNPNFAGYAAFRNSLFSPTVAGDYQWYSNYDGFMFVNAADKARADIQGAIRWWDEYGGNSSGGSEITNPLVLNGDFGYYPSGYKINDSVISKTATVTFTDYAISQISTQVNDGYKLMFYLTSSAYGTSLMAVRYNNNSPLSVTYNDTSSESSTRVSYTLYVGGANVSICNMNSLNGSGGNLTLNCTSIGSFNQGPYFSGNGYFYMYSNGASSGGGGSGGGGGPIPEPEPTVPEPDPKPNYDTNININGSINIDNSTTGNTEFELDLTELLDILKTINDNLVSFAEDFHNMWDWWAEEMGVIESDIRTFQNVISTWLQMIYERLASIGSPNPTTQPTSWLDWLRALLSALVGDLPSSIGGIQQSLSALQRLFPFSIPWDLAVLLGLFVSNPVTPVFDLPFPYSANDVAYIHVDCSQWNGIMSAVRSVELLIFAAALALRTRELIKGVEVE